MPPAGRARAMGVIREGLYDHEGYAARKLPDGTLTGTWTAATAAFTAYVASCACGWAATAEHPPTEAGEDTALHDWAGHADQQQAAQQARCRQQLAETLRALGGIAAYVHNPANLPRIARAAQRARGLAGELADDQEARP
jgi:hypothetical protein